MQSRLTKISDFLFSTARPPFWADSHRSAQPARKRKKSEISASSIGTQAIGQPIFSGGLLWFNIITTLLGVLSMIYLAYRNVTPDLTTALPTMARLFA